LGALVVAEAKLRAPDLLVRAALGRGDALALESRDVVIDVTTAGSTAAHARACVERRATLVVATTGMSPDDERALDDAARAIPVLVAANLSVSAHVAASLVRDASRRLPTFDAEVVEVHHKRKLDAPSGTALMLARAAAEGRAQDLTAPGVLRTSRQGHAPRAVGEIGVSAVRGGDVVGEHTVLLLGEGERLEVVHRITDRCVFARGALAAALFLSGKAPGRYTMADVVSR
jgi:4-hydroxy-tetrahydrodipicolinate reductase